MGIEICPCCQANILQGIWFDFGALSTVVHMIFLEELNRDTNLTEEKIWELTEFSTNFTHYNMIKAIEMMELAKYLGEEQYSSTTYH